MITIAIFCVYRGVWHHHVPGAFAFALVVIGVIEALFVRFLYRLDRKSCDP